MSLQKEENTRDLSLSNQEQRKGHVSVQQQDGRLQARKKGLIRNQSYQHSDVHLPVSKTVRNEISAV